MSFIAQFSEIHAEIRRRGIAAYDMRDEGHLELVYVSASGFEVDGAGGGETPLTWLEEEPARPRPVPPPSTPSPIRYFLDGSQRTLRAFYCDNVPVVTGVVAAAVLERNDTGEPRIVPGMLAFRHVWVVPTVTDCPGLNQLIEIIQERSGEIVDPLDGLTPDQYQAELREFGGVVERAFKRVGKEREELERTLLRRWCAEIGVDRGMLLVDGQLRATAPGAVGLVKSFTKQYVTGDASTALFRMRHGERSAAFRVDRGNRSSAPVDAWYQRHWDATGRDPRHALVRLELSTDWTDHPTFDDVAGWVMRERVPAAKADARWATLLYPVHYLEAMLKRRIDAETRGWTSRRG